MPREMPFAVARGAGERGQMESFWLDLITSTRVETRAT
jgi:hypothetical protein